MTKKSGLFEVDVDLNLLKFENEATVKHVKNNSKMIKDAIQIVKRQMISSGLRPRTIKDYETIVNHLKDAQAITFLNEITLD